MEEAALKSLLLIVWVKWKLSKYQAKTTTKIAKVGLGYLGGGCKHQWELKQSHRSREAATCGVTTGVAKVLVTLGHWRMQTSATVACLWLYSRFFRAC